MIGFLDGAAMVLAGTTLGLALVCLTKRRDRRDWHVLIWSVVSVALAFLLVSANVFAAAIKLLITLAYLGVVAVNYYDIYRLRRYDRITSALDQRRKAAREALEGKRNGNPE